MKDTVIDQPLVDRNSRWPLLAVSLTLYVVGAAAWLWVLKNAEPGRSIVAFTVVFMVAAVIAGALLGERITPRLCAGLVLATISLYLVETA